MQPNIYNFFKFLKDKEGRPIPFKIKLIYTPETITPEDLDVKGFLDLENTKITSLPDDLQVKGNLYLKNASITSLPKGLKVGGNLYLANTPLAKKSNEEIKAMIGPTGFIKGKIIDK